MDSIEESAFRDSREIEITSLTLMSSDKDQPSHIKDKPVVQSKTNVNMFISQSKAILYKNISFQLKQTVTNIFHIFTPFICILIIWVSKNEILKEFKDSYALDKISGIPFFLNMPFSFLSQSSAYPIASDDCNKWIMYQDIRNPDRHIQDDFTPREILHSQFYELCGSVEKSVPYFVETNYDVNSNLLLVLDELNSKNITAGVNVEGLEALPDAGITITELNKHRLVVDVQVNDHLYIEYHRNNGFTKQSFKIPKEAFHLFTNPNLNMTDLINGNRSSFSHNSELLLNKTQTSFERLFKNRTVTFPVK